MQSFGLVEWKTFSQYPENQANNNETSAFVDMIWRAFIDYNQTEVHQQVAAGNFAKIETYVSQRLGDFYAFINVVATLGERYSQLMLFPPLQRYPVEGGAPCKNLPQLEL